VSFSRTSFTIVNVFLAVHWNARPSSDLFTGVKDMLTSPELLELNPKCKVAGGFPREPAGKEQESVTFCPSMKG
jgi:hypothetical protein